MTKTPHKFPDSNDVVWTKAESDLERVTYERCLTYGLVTVQPAAISARCFSSISRGGTERSVIVCPGGLAVSGDLSAAAAATGRRGGYRSNRIPAVLASNIPTDLQISAVLHSVKYYFFWREKQPAFSNKTWMSSCREHHIQQHSHSSTAQYRRRRLIFICLKK